MLDQNDYQQDRLNSAAHIEYEAACSRAERARFLTRPSVMLGLVPQPDGPAWSVLYGSNIMEGVVGYGDTPDEAMADFDRNWTEGKTPEARRLAKQSA